MYLLDLKTTSSTKERGMVFFWQGDECSINAKGAVAAISVEIDEEGNLHKVSYQFASTLHNSN